MHRLIHSHNGYKGQSQECRAPAGSPVWVAVPKQLGHLLSPSHVLRQGVGSEVEKLGLHSMPFIRMSAEPVVPQHQPHFLTLILSLLAENLTTAETA